MNNISFGGFRIFSLTGMERAMGMVPHTGVPAFKTFEAAQETLKRLPKFATENTRFHNADTFIHRIVADENTPMSKIVEILKKNLNHSFI